MSDENNSDPGTKSAGKASAGTKKPRKTATRKSTAGKSTGKRSSTASGSKKKTGASAVASAVEPATTLPAPTGAAPAATASRQAGPASDKPVALLRTPMTVRWRDLDAFNHVNNSQYLSYLEEARLRWMIGIPGQGLDDDVAPVVAAAHLNYRRPIEWPAEIAIELFVERLGNTSLNIGHRIVSATDDRTLYCDGYVVLVWIDRATGQPASLPAAVREACSD